MDLIPCEYCDRYVQFDIYNIHVSTCRIFSSVLNINRTIFNNPPIQESTNESNVNNEPEYNSETDSDIPELEEYNEQPLPQLPPSSPLPELPELEEYIEPTLPELEPFINAPVPNFFVFNGETNLDTSFSLFDIPNNSSNNVDINLNAQINRLEVFRNILNNINIPNSYNTNLNNEYENLSNLEERIGKVTIGIKDLSLISEDYKLEKEEECIICREEFEENHIIKKLHCNHIFCRNCINTWFKDNTKCPVCQKDFNDDKNIIINK